MNLWDFLEFHAVREMAPLSDLYHWSLNYSTGEGPFTAFLDLIGWSQENLGEPIYNWTSPKLGYLELEYLADALKKYATSPSDAEQFINQVLELESN